MRVAGERRGVDQTHSRSHGQNTEMSVPADRSSVSSISLLEIKAESQLVLRAFIGRSLDFPEADRPGRVGGAYKDYDKYSYQPKPKEGCDFQAEDGSSGDEKKKGIKDRLKLPLHNTIRKAPKDPKSSLERDKKSRIRDLSEEDGLSPSSTSGEEDSEKNQKKLSRKIKRRLSKFFSIKLEKEREREREKERDKERDKDKVRDKNKNKDGDKKKNKEDHGTQRPSSLMISKAPQPAEPVVSPSRPPEFYNEVAQKLEKIAHRSTSIKKVRPPPPPSPAVCEKEALVKELVSVLCAEGDSINKKIESDPFMRSSFSRLSYASFAKMLDMFSSAQAVEAPPQLPPASPTLQRMAVSMEVSRQLVTATGTQRLQGYAECYMESFSPWIKSQGGWEGVVDLTESECD